LNVLKSHVRITIETLLRNGKSQREIERLTGVDRKTIRRYGKPSNSPGVATGSAAGRTGVDAIETPPPRPPAMVPKHARSTCEEHREWIEAQAQLGRNAQSIYQDLVEQYGSTHRYNSVKRFMRAIKVREPERFDVLEIQAGE
jgi:transposase